MALHFCHISLPLSTLCLSAAAYVRTGYEECQEQSKEADQELGKGEKLSELEATPERCQKEIVDMERKLKILEVYMCVCVCTIIAMCVKCENNMPMQTCTIALVQ